MPSADEISETYSKAVNKAVGAHEQGVKSHNAKLAKDLEKASGDEQARQEILAAFDEKIAPVRDAYHAATEQAAAERDAALDKVG